MRLLSDQSHPVWVGSAGLLFEYTGKRWAGVTVSTMPSDKEYLYVRAIDMGPGRRWRQVDVARVARNQWVSVRAVLDQKGYLAVTTGNYSKRIKIGPRPVVRSVVHCQSSSFEIDLRPPQ